ncbi:hypothetical protein [Nocardia transvalensis]|uniref:hypothetical protein n=1 Tax=Nocardia transvalensis TaxID=37333 RepID=UPI001895F651|nr:hypothetical protein [Nocardia transvalensis]MBF6331947.1 hypothetical protein [Nocardia transvalensis]
MGQSAGSGHRNRLVVVVSDEEKVGSAAARAVVDLAGERNSRATRPPAAQPDNSDYLEVLTRARRFLGRATPDDVFLLVEAPSLAQLPAAISAVLGADSAVLTLLIVDHRDYRYPVTSPGVLQDQLTELAAVLPASIEFEVSPSSVQVYTEPHLDPFVSLECFTPRWPPEHEWIIVADIACAVVDSVQAHRTKRFRPDLGPSAVGGALAEFLDNEAGTEWGLHYFTGSVVASLIDDLADHARRNGNPVVRGPSEHSLACSALARWTLDHAPFLIVVTSGMHDEFRGTLANLVRARAPGFIVCADSRLGQWYPFQGTIHHHEDSRAALRAKGLAVVHLATAADIAGGLGEAFAHYRDGRGPVMILASRDVLEAGGGLGPVEIAPAVERPRPRSRLTISASALEDLMSLVNSAPKRLLCQPAELTDTGRDLLYTLAANAGIALADSLARPGAVGAYHRGAPVREFLGTMSLYGSSARVHAYLHSDGRVRPASEQALLFVETPIPELDTPFSEPTLRRIAPAQIISDDRDRAPFARIVVTGHVEKVLLAALDRLEVDPAVLTMRRRAIDSTIDSRSDVIGLLPIRPMTTNYFARRFRAELTRLIEEDGYTYVGVYDVGRTGLSTISNLPRTGVGYSAWFGRALMGDGVQALPGVLTRRNTNVLAFVGDGSAALTPDIVPTLIQQVVVDGSPFRHNLSIFRFVNGSHSVIRTYRESHRLSAVGTQTGVLTFTGPEWERSVGPLTLRHRHVLSFDDIDVARLPRPETIDLYSVILGHNNEGDGLSPLSALSWQSDELSSRALAVAGVLPSSRRDDYPTAARADRGG